VALLGVLRMSSEADSSNSWLDYVNSLTWARGSLDQSSYCSFLRAASLGVKPQQALDLAAAKIKETGDHPNSAKLNQQIRRAFGFATASGRPDFGGHLPKAQRPTFIPDYAHQFAERVPAEVGASWLRKQSPVKVPWLLTPVEFLAAAYQMGDKILIFSGYKSQGQEIWQRCSLKINRNELRSFERGHAEGVWFLNNPIDGHEHFNERQQKMSRRSEESITAFRYAVLESDCQPIEQWLRILVQLPLPIVSITSSGGKSLHALVRVDATSKSNWDDTIRAIKPKLSALGADPGALTAVRLTRLPNCYRGERLQELLYLNPNPEGGPIWCPR
jgi:hypothetical protein